jgi:hypothetical protein
MCPVCEKRGHDDEPATRNGRCARHQSPELGRPIEGHPDADLGERILQRLKEQTNV